MNLADPVAEARLRGVVAEPTLLRCGLVLFLLGLSTGFLMPLFANARMGLASHLEGVMNGMLLMLLAVLWPSFAFGPRLARWGRRLAIYGTFANWLATFVAACWGAGAMMPIAGQGRTGAAWQEQVVAVLLLSLSVVMVALVGLCLWAVSRGRRRGRVLG